MISNEHICHDTYPLILGKWRAWGNSGGGGGDGGEQVSNQTYFDQKHHRLTDRVHLVWLMFKTNSLLVLVIY